VDGKLLAGDSSTRDIYRFDDAGQPQPLTAQGQPFGQIGIPMDIVNDAEGNLLVSDLELHRIVKVPKAGGNAEKVLDVNAPRGLFYDAQQQLWIISGRRLVRFAAAGKLEVIVDAGVFEFPHTVVVKSDGAAYVCDNYANAIWKVAPGQKPEKWVSGAPLVRPVGMAALGDKLIVVDPHAKAVFEIDASGKLTKRETKPAQP
jgi:streptogramin lyase